MIGLVDYHMHTVLSDGQNDHEEMVLAAIEKGLDEIGFTDHVCIIILNSLWGNSPCFTCHSSMYHKTRINSSIGFLFQNHPLPANSSFRVCPIPIVVLYPVPQ